MARYVKIPHAIQDDPDLWRDPLRLSTYVRLKVLADLHWPHAVDPPGWVKPAVLRWLHEHGYIVCDRDSDSVCYRVSDIDSDRALRQSQSQAARQALFRSRAGLRAESEAETDTERERSNGAARDRSRSMTKLADLLPDTGRKV